MFATACFNLYLVFDFITFQETLENSIDSFKKDKFEFQTNELNFAMVNNAKIGVLFFSFCKLSSFLAHTIGTNLFDENQRGASMVHDMEVIATGSFSMMLVSMLIVCFGGESFEEKEDVKQNLNLGVLMTGFFMLSLFLSLAHTALSK